MVLRLASAAFLIILPATLFAGEKGGKTEEDGYFRHHVSAFLGGSHTAEKDGGTLGAGYEFRFNRYIGAGAVYEHVGQNFRENLAVFSGMVHPWKGLMISAGGGYERAPETEEHRESSPEVVQGHGLFRLGAGYEWEIKERFTIGPEIAFDWAGSERVFVYGISIGWGMRRVH